MLTRRTLLKALPFVGSLAFWRKQKKQPGRQTANTPPPEKYGKSPVQAAKEVWIDNSFIVDTEATGMLYLDGELIGPIERWTITFQRENSHIHGVVLMSGHIE